MRRRSLDKALRAVGSVHGLARRLLVTPGVVRGWLRKTPQKPLPVTVGGAILRPGDEKVLRAAAKRLGAKRLGLTPGELKRLKKGIPSAEETPDWKVESLLREIANAKRKSREEEQTFNTLLKLAGEATVRRARRGKKGKVVIERVAAMPRVRSKEGRRSGLRTAGYQWVKAFRRELSKSVIREIEAWSHTFGKGKGHPLWQATALLAQYALHPSKNFEAGQRTGSPKPHELIVQLKHDKAGSFNIEMPVATRAGTKPVVAADLTTRLTTILEDPLLRSYVYSVRFVNYRRRTPSEKRAVSTSARRKRTQLSKKREAYAKGVRNAKKKKRVKAAKRKQKRPSTAGGPPLRGAMRASRGQTKKTTKTVKKRKGAKR